MSRVNLGVLVAIPFFCTLIAPSVLAADAATCPTRVGVEATVSAVEGREGVLRLKAEAKDLATGTMLFAPQVYFRRGDGGAANGSLPGGGEIRYAVSVEGSTATFKFETLCGKELITSQQVKVQISQ